MRFLQQLIKARYKILIVLLRPFAGAFQVVLVADTAQFLQLMSFGQQTINVLVRISPAVMIDSIRPLGESHRRHALILRDHNISRLAEIDESKVHGIRSRANDNVTYIKLGHLHLG